MYKYADDGIAFRYLDGKDEAYSYKEEKWIQSESAFATRWGIYDEDSITSKEAKDIIALYTQKRRENEYRSIKKIAKELSKKIKSSITVDWNIRESVRAKIRFEIKTILKKYNYPPMFR